MEPEVWRALAIKAASLERGGAVFSSRPCQRACQVPSTRQGGDALRRRRMQARLYILCDDTSIRSRRRRRHHFIHLCNNCGVDCNKSLDFRIWILETWGSHQLALEPELRTSQFASFQSLILGFDEPSSKVRKLLKASTILQTLRYKVAKWCHKNNSWQAIIHDFPWVVKIWLKDALHYVNLVGLVF